MRNKILCLVLLPIAACMPHARAYVGASFMQAKGDIGLQNSVDSVDLGQSGNSLDNIGIGDASGSAYLRAEAEWGPHRARLSGFGLTPSGQGTINQSFGDLAAGIDVRSQLDYVNITGAYTWDLLPTEMFRLGIGLELGSHSFDLTVEERTSASFERIQSDLLLPMPCVDAELDLGPVSVCAALGGFEVDIADAQGSFFDAEAFARWEPYMGVELIAGWRSLSFDTSGDADGRAFRADFEIAGWFLGGGIAF